MKAKSPSKEGIAQDSHAEVSCGTFVIKIGWGRHPQTFNKEGKNC